ncbi:MAG: T9SS type A sorting domain-containing protein [Balneolales bacterium]
MAKHSTTLMIMALLLLFSAHTSLVQAQAITIDGDMSDWEASMQLDVEPNRPMETWHEVDEAGGEHFNRAEPADPENLDWKKDLDMAGIWAADDENWLYFRLDLNPLADVRKVLEDTLEDGMYPRGGNVGFNISTDPQFDMDLQDTTGMTWGWYQNGVDFTVRVLSVDEEYFDSTGYHNPISEHRQLDEEGEPITGGAFSIYQRAPELGSYHAWNDDWNIVEVAIPRSVIQQPVYLPEQQENPFVSAYGSTSSWNGEEDPWWQQYGSNNSGIAGYVHTYQTTFSGNDPDGPPGPSSIFDNDTRPDRFELVGNYPNPFNPTTSIRFNLDQTENVRLEVYDILGRPVASMDYGVMNTGTHNVSFDGSGLSSGMYLYTITAGQEMATGKMMLMK